MYGLPSLMPVWPIKLIIINSMSNLDTGTLTFNLQKCLDDLI